MQPHPPSLSLLRRGTKGEVFLFQKYALLHQDEIKQPPSQAGNFHSDLFHTDNLVE
jgi:hypothetical protein